MKPLLHDYWRSSASYRVRIALGLAGLEFDTCSVNLMKGEQKGRDHLARNPQGLVPTLEIDGQVLSQSLAIVEYLDERGDYQFLPTDPVERARVRTLAYAIAMEIHPVCNIAVAGHAAIVAGIAEDRAMGSEPFVDWMHNFMPPGLAALERLLDHPATGPFCHGDAPTMADLCLLPQIYNARRWGISIESLTTLSGIIGRLEAIDAFRTAHPDNFREDG